MIETMMALQALADLHRVPVTRRLIGRYATAFAGFPEAAIVAAIVRAGRECRRFPAPEAILKRLPNGSGPAPHEIPRDAPPAPTDAERAAVRRLAADYLAGYERGQK